MRFLLVILISVFLTACGGTDNNPEETTGTLMEIEPSADELNTIALMEQPEIVQDFFNINPTILGTDFCYDNNAITDLILHGNDSSTPWVKFEVSDNYLTIYNEECQVLLEFMTFKTNGGKRAFLSQMNKSVQQFNYLNWNETTGNWVNSENYPRPRKADYFSGLTPHEEDLATNYGGDFIYINPTEENATFVFSDWLMSMNMGEKQMDEFVKSADYDFELLTTDSQLTLNRVYIGLTTETSGRFLIAYSESQAPRGSFRKKYDALLASFSKDYLSAKLIHYGSNNFNAYFPTDTFNLANMGQFEPRDGFWVYTYGKEPLDLDADQDLTQLVRKISTYFNEE